MDQQTTSDGRPFGPIRYKEIVKECYLISKNINTSYTDLLNITPVERNYMLQFLVEEAKEREDMLNKRRAEQEANRRNR